jgi:uncharacterized membrane protein YdjX (TVP38/TMEM64 family)
MHELGSALIGAVDWLRMQGPASLPLAFAVFVVANAALVPASALCVALGFVYGFWPGFAVAALARPSAAALACLLARKVARAHVQGWADRRPALLAIDRALAGGGLRIIVLLRLSPLISSTVVNWLLGVTRVSYRDFLLGSALGVLPGTLAYAYIGSGLEAARQIVADRPEAAYQRWLFWAGMAATLACVAVVSRLARRELQRVLTQT